MAAGPWLPGSDSCFLLESFLLTFIVTRAEKSVSVSGRMQQVE